MNKTYTYYVLIFIIIIHFSRAKLTLLKLNEIKLVIKGTGTQQILYNLFPYDPSEVIVNGTLRESCRKSCYLENEDKNEVIITFNSQINTCEYMFHDLSNIIEADLSNFDSSQVISMAYMFEGCNNLKRIDFGEIDTSLVSSIHSIFKKCGELTFIDMSKFNTRNLEDMYDTFSECHKLIAVKMQNFDTSKTRIMRGIFHHCYALKYADISNFQTPCVSDVQYLFERCDSLIYADLSSFIIHHTINTDYMFLNANSNIKMCIRDDTTINYLPIFRNQCSDNCFNNNIKIDLRSNTCINNCNECLNNYEYYKLCFDICPENTYPKINEFLCLDKKPKGYYLDNDIHQYNLCYQTCKDCKLKGNETNNNCIECKNGYNFLTDTMYSSNNNCYPICNDFFYFDESNIFHCITQCPEQFNKIINEKKKCINECKNDDTYRYEYNNICFQDCPTESRFLFNYYCIDEIITNQTTYLQLIKNKVIKVVNIEDLDNDLNFMNRGVAYTVSTTSNQNRNLLMNNVTSVNFGDCINKLKDKYNISKDEEENLYILKIDIPIEGMKIPKIEYEVYYPLYNQKLIQLDLSVCQDTRINISIPINISLDDLDLFNSSSGLYNDICYILTSDVGTDKSLKDRKMEFINKNLTPCEENCKFIDYDNTTKKAICSCYTKIELPIISEVKINTNLLLSNFKDIKNIGNFKMLKCLYLIFQKENIFKNSSNYIILFIFLLSLVAIFFFAYYDYMYIKKIIEEIIKKKNMKKVNRIETKNININKKQNKNIISNNKYNFKKVRKLRPITKRYFKQCAKANKLRFERKMKNKINAYENNINFLIINKTNKNKKNKRGKQKKNILIKRVSFNKLDYIDDELNDLEYKDAIKVDKRTYAQYYISLLKAKNLFIFSFITKNDYNSKIIKIYLFFYTFLIEYVISAMFYTDSTMHEIYVDEGSFDIIYQLPQIIYSSLISNVINFIITTLGLFQGDILKIKNCNINIISRKTKEVLKCIKCKIISFFIITYIFLILFWAYLGCFCVVYKNTQIHLLIEVLSSFATSLITPLFLNLLPGIFRIPSLKNIKSNRYILYKFSKILQIL